MLSVNTNISSLNAQRSLLSNSQGAAVAMERLASGKRINSAKDLATLALLKAWSTLFGQHSS